MEKKNRKPIRLIIVTGILLIMVTCSLVYAHLGDFYASYDKVGMVVVIAVMAVTAIGCFVRDRLELV